MGISQETYHLMATIPGAFAAVLTIVGFIPLMIRRFEVCGGVRRKTTRNDKIMLVLLAIPMLLGAYATFHHQVFGAITATTTVRQSAMVALHLPFNPKIELMADVPLDFTLHVICGHVAHCYRAVHAPCPKMFSVPVGYTTRPYIARGKSSARHRALAVGIQ